MKNGFKRFAPRITCNNNEIQHHKKRMLIVIQFDPSRSFFHRDR